MTDKALTEQEMFDKLWFSYPTDLCKNKRGGKQPAFNAFKKLKVDEKEFNRIMLNLQAQIRNDRNDPDAYRWPFVSSYLNQKRFDDTVDIVEKPVYVGSTCEYQSCTNEVHGPKFKHCVYHLPTDQNDPVLSKLRQKYVDMGLKQRPDETNDAHVARMRVVYGKLIGTIL